MKNRWLLYVAAGFELGFAVIAGIILGSYLDGWIGTENPYFTILGLLGGMVTGFTFLLRMLNMKDDREK